MSRNFWSIVVGCTAFGVGLPTTASANDRVLSPISAGALVGPRLQAATVGLGIGDSHHGRGVEFIGRAALGPSVQIGMGGPRGSYAFIDEQRLQLGLSLATTFGGGLYRGTSAGVLAAVEPGLFLRVFTKKAGSIQFDTAWYQPVWIPPGAIAGGVLASVSWSPRFSRP